MFWKSNVHHRRPTLFLHENPSWSTTSNAPLQRGSLTETLYSFMQGLRSQGHRTFAVNAIQRVTTDVSAPWFLWVTLCCSQQLDYTASKWSWSDPGTIPTFAGRTEENHENLQSGYPVLRCRVEHNTFEYEFTVSPLPQIPSVLLFAGNLDSFLVQAGQPEINYSVVSEVVCTVMSFTNILCISALKVGWQNVDSLIFRTPYWNVKINSIIASGELCQCGLPVS
jgi:hypothetical protein